MNLFTKEELEKKIRFNKFFMETSLIIIGAFLVISLMRNTNSALIPFIIFFNIARDSDTRIRMYEIELKRLMK